jgi:hypothetical protein
MTPSILIYHYAECHDLVIIMLSVIIQSVVILSVIILSVVTPLFGLGQGNQKSADLGQA